MRGPPVGPLLSGAGHVRACAMAPSHCEGSTPLPGHSPQLLSRGPRDSSPPRPSQATARLPWEPSPLSLAGSSATRPLQLGPGPARGARPAPSRPWPLARAHGCCQPGPSGPLFPRLARVCSHCPVPPQEVHVPPEGARAQAPEAGGRRPEEPQGGSEIPEGFPEEVAFSDSLPVDTPEEKQKNGSFVFVLKFPILLLNHHLTVKK